MLETPVENNLPLGKALPDITALPSQFTQLDLLFHINCLIEVCHLCISTFLIGDFITMAYDKGYLGFNRCYKIVLQF